MKLSEELTWRGFVNQTTFKDLAALDGQPMTFYWGVDPSADSMTVGHLAIAMMVRHFMSHGHQAVLLVGGATGMIGDPDGKKQERDLLGLDELESNKKALAKQYDKLFAGQKFKVVDNYDWFKDIKYLEFLREVGKHTSVTQLLDREFIKSRIGKDGSGISYAEFSYSLIQGYDFLHLFRKHQVTLQVCGADQWGNSIAGVDLIRKLEGQEAHVFSAPLVVNKATGVKFGKTEAGAIWLDERKTSVFQFYQFWLNTDDENVTDYLKLYSLLTKDELEKLTQATKEQPASRAAQKALAFDVTATVHGKNQALGAQKISEVLFDNRNFEDLNKNELELLVKSLPVSKADTLTKSLVDLNLSNSSSEARRFIESGAVSVNGKRVDSDINLNDLSSKNNHLLIKRGKNSFGLLRLS